jgi:SAM-dependent methyltransferase
MTTALGGARAAIIDRLVNTAGKVRSEATIQSDVRMMLLDSELGLEQENLDVQLETHVGGRRRIDVEVGRTVFEVKRSLATPAAIAAALEQLGDYVHARSEEMGQRYVGVLTDGRLWIAYNEVQGALSEASRHVATAGATGGEQLLRWLEGVLATRRAIRPTPAEIAQRLGANSSSHALDQATLTALYNAGQGLPTVRVKRELWAKLLRGALGTQFPDTDELFVEHTLLVNSADVIAHLMLGLNAEELSPATLLSGDQFTLAGLHGVVDRDFFDWVLEIEGGDTYVAALTRRLACFDWSQVEHDVLKVLYESVIPAETRKTLGEYYTPDWLANRIVSQVFTDPLNQRLLDPACGSGTFLFYAVRRFFDAAHNSGLDLAEAMARVSAHVVGIDLHPVAVALARVTYLLALGRERLNTPGRGMLSVPVYLGDSLGWEQHDDLLTVDHLVIPTDPIDELFSGELRFPEHLLADSAAFDDLVQSLVDEAGRAAGTAKNRLSDGTVRRLALLNANFLRLKELHQSGRNHIWSYYIRNVSRPAWLARDENRVDVLLGNPPWLSYRHMTPAMQQRFKSLATERNFWRDEATATHQDLAGVFIARAVERYLKTGGRLAFVVPNSVLDRDYWTGFRSGRYDGANVAFTTSWDLRRIRPHLFPRAAGVVFGNRAKTAAAMSTTALIWSGRAPHRHAQLDDAAAVLQAIGQLTVRSVDADKSPYAKRFSQGANLVPRFMFRVQDAPSTGLGVPAGRANVRSKRSPVEKTPWKDLPDLAGIVESEFVWSTLLGEQVVQFHVRKPERFVIPLTRAGELLDGQHNKIDAYPGLANWVRVAESLWTTHGQSTMTLAEQIDHMSKLTQQVPVRPLRVVYTKSGMHVSAALVNDGCSIIDHVLYWATVRSTSEGHYLTGILNSPSLTELVRPLMSYGKDERHIDKAVWDLPIPEYDAKNEVHVEISQLASDLAAQIADMTFRSDNFVTIRRDLRRHLASNSTAQRLDQLVATMLGADADVSDDGADLEISDALSRTPVLIRTSRTTSAPLNPDVQIDVDCEFDDTGRVYLWGALLSSPQLEAPVYHAFGDQSPTVDEKSLAATFLDWLTSQLETAESHGHSAGWFYYGNTESHQLRRILGPAADPILRTATDILGDVIRPDFFAPRGYSLKRLAPAAGAHWRAGEPSGADTYGWINATRTGDSHAWQQLTDYNEDDTKALFALRNALLQADSVGSVLSIPATA